MVILHSLWLIYTWHAQLPFNYHCEGMMISRPETPRWGACDSSGHQSLMTAFWLISRDTWGYSPTVKSNQGGILKGKWFHFNASNFCLKRRDNQHFISYLNPASACRGKKAGARCSESPSDTDMTLQSWPCWTLSLWKAKESFLYDHRTRGRGDGGECFEGPLSLLLSEACRYVLIIIS